MIEQLTLEKIEAIVNQIPAAQNVSRDEDHVTFQYHDKDKDDVTSVISLFNEERASVSLLLPVPATHKITAMIVSHGYNSRKDAHGTFAYVMTMGDDDQDYMILETHLSSRGGVTEEAIRQQIRTFIENINLFENVMLSGISDLGPDATFTQQPPDSAENFENN